MLGCRGWKLLLRRLRGSREAGLLAEARTQGPSGVSGGWCRVGVLGAVRRLLRGRPRSAARIVPSPEEARSTSRAPPPDDRTRPPLARSLNPSLHLKSALPQSPNPRLNPLP